MEKQEEKASCSLSGGSAGIGSHYEHYNPPWFRWFILSAVIIMYGGACISCVFVLQTNRLWGLLGLIPLIFLCLLWGGIELYLSPGEFIIKLGWLHLPLKRIQTHDIQAVWPLHTCPMVFFGYAKWKLGFGSGIGFILGTKAVRLRLKNGRQIAFSTACQEKWINLIAENTNAEILPLENRR